MPAGSVIGSFQVSGKIGLTTTGGVSSGIDCIGLPWMTRRGSSIINGIVGDAEMIGERIEGRVRSSA